MLTQDLMESPATLNRCIAILQSAGYSSAVEISTLLANTQAELLNAHADDIAMEQMSVADLTYEATSIVYASIAEDVEKVCSELNLKLNALIEEFRTKSELPVANVIINWLVQDDYLPTTESDGSLTSRRSFIAAWIANSMLQPILKAEAHLNEVQCDEPKLTELESVMVAEVSVEDE